MNEEKRVCKKCNIEKPLQDFPTKKTRGVLYYSHKCKSCLNEEHREKYKQDENMRIKNRQRANKYRQEHKEEIKEKRKEYFKEYNKKYYDENKEYYKEYKQREDYKEQQKEYREKNKDKITEQRKQYKKEHHEEILEKRKKWDKKYRDSHLEQRKKWLEDNKELVNKNKREYHQNRVQTDPLYKFEKQIRGVITSSFTRKQYKKNSHTYDIIGLNSQDFIDYLLETFKNNYGYEWDGKEKVHIDHIIPLAIAETEEEIIKLCYYTNLQLLKEKDNLEKHDKLDYKIKRED